MKHIPFYRYPMIQSLPYMGIFFLALNSNFFCTAQKKPLSKPALNFAHIQLDELPFPTFRTKRNITTDAAPCISIVIALPKSGSNLLTKCLGLILSRGSDDIIFRKNLPFPQSLYELSLNDLCAMIQESQQIIWHTHLIYKPEYAVIFKETQSPIFFGYRDPRDLLVSLARFMKQCPGIWHGADKIPMDNLIMDLILHNNSTNNNPPVKGVFNLYQAYLPWRDAPGCYSVRFENLVGAQGGGSQEKQIQEIKNIAHHVGVIITDDRAQDIAQNLFGGTWTFDASRDVVKEKAGQIGSWKNYFTQEHKKAFKTVAGQLLIDLQYEQDFNW